MVSERMNGCSTMIEIMFDWTEKTVAMLIQLAKQQSSRECTNKTEVQ